MKKINILRLVAGISLVFSHSLFAQTGYYDAPYTRYEADLGTLNNATITSRSYVQSDLQSEASDQVCVMMTSANASVSWPVTADGDGLVVRYSIPDGQTGSLAVYNNGTQVGTLNLTTYYSWEYLKNNPDPNDVNITNANPRMRFDEVRLQLPSKVLTGDNLQLVWLSGTIALDFAELEAVPAALTAASGDVTYSGDGSTLQTFINNNGGKTIYLPPGTYNVNSELYFGPENNAANTVLKGAGMWYTEIHFTGNGTTQYGGLHGNDVNVSFSDMYLSTVRNSRTNSYKGINGVFTSGSTITNLWVEHFECGAWIAQFNSTGPSIADGFTLSNCRFRNNFADGINLSKGTSNSIVEHCSFRNNGDDDMAIWSANNQSCDNNTFRYNTAENSWRSSGCAIYGGTNNQAHHLIIKDNLESGIRVNNSFAGAPFNTGGMHVFSDITIITCGTFNDIYNNPVGAIDISCTNMAGPRVNNVKFSNITITNSRNDAVYIAKKNSSADGFYNLVFENITITGTGKEYPGNDAQNRNATWGRGYAFLFVGNPAGYATYCNLTYTGRGGNATSYINNAQIGTLTWTSAGCGTYVTSPANGTVFGECGPPITITADASTSYGAIDSIEFFIDGKKVGAALTAPYTFDWSNFTLGNHSIYVKSTHEPSATKITSPTSIISVAYYKGMFATTTAPTIDGTADALWSNYDPASIDKLSVGTFSGSADLSANYKITYDQNNLYLFVDVTDDVLVNDGGNKYDNDALEVFIDIGNTKSSGYQSNDYTYNFVYNDATVYENTHGTAGTVGVTFAQAVKTGGYTMEISIPWSTIGPMPTNGQFMGFDIHVDDDDNGGARDAKKAWNDCADVAWKDPAAFGTLQDSSCATSVPTGFVDFHGVLTNNKAVLTWSTYYDSNDYNFVITRATGSGSFSNLTTRSATGTQGTLSTLSYTDNATPSGSVSYRISKVDKAGCIIESDIVTLTVATGIIEDQASETEYDFYPNPFVTSGNLKFSSDNADEGEFTVTISDLSGKLVWTKDLSKNSTTTIGDQLSPGMYLLEITDGATKKTIKLIKL